MEKPAKIAPAKGKLGILLPGMGAVSTTFMAGVELIRRNKACPIGSLTQMGTIRLGKRTEGRSPLIKKFVPLADPKDLDQWRTPFGAFAQADRAHLRQRPYRARFVSADQFDTRHEGGADSAHSG